ncbi:J domain-containing protein [Vibrio chagasii]|uniref:J domain-containing protein n=1 Tax=Vibrio chagasii TaxID=170679 RepID=UPI00228447B0|nr:J domain-containing protein [Vibrio chagasii]MCY9826474.1 J domain-containing protein [Vibrio chagasii]
MTTVPLSFLATTPSTPKQKNKLNQLWEEIEKKQRRIERYQAKLDAFYQDFKTSTEEQEQAVCRAAEHWIHHLLTFIPRKTIKGPQREALYDWIQEELRILEANPFNPVDSRVLREAFDQALLASPLNQAKDISISEEEMEAFREEISIVLGYDLDLSDDELMTMIKDPRKFHDYLQSVIAEEMEEEHLEEDDIEWGGESDFSQTDDQAHFEASHHQESDALYSDKQITKLYRQLAKQLHPDKETDEEKKSEKSALMQQLSQAKKDKDVVALLILAQQHLPEHEMVMDEGMLERLKMTLTEKIEQLNVDYQELQQGGDIKSIIWQRFGGGNKASRQKGLREYREHLQKEAQDLLAECQEIKTVKQLQLRLKQRIDASRFNNPFFQIDPSELFS